MAAALVSQVETIDKVDLLLSVFFCFWLSVSILRWILSKSKLNFSSSPGLSSTWKDFHSSNAWFLLFLLSASVFAHRTTSSSSAAVQRLFKNFIMVSFVIFSPEYASRKSGRHN